MKILGGRGERECLLPRALPRTRDPARPWWTDVTVALESGNTDARSSDPHFLTLGPLRPLALYSRIGVAGFNTHLEPKLEREHPP